MKAYMTETSTVSETHSQLYWLTDSAKYKFAKQDQFPVYRSATMSPCRVWGSATECCNAVDLPLYTGRLKSEIVIKGTRAGCTAEGVFIGRNI